MPPSSLAYYKLRHTLNVVLIIGMQGVRSLEFMNPNPFLSLLLMLKSESKCANFSHQRVGNTIANYTQRSPGKPLILKLERRNSMYFGIRIGSIATIYFTFFHCSPFWNILAFWAPLFEEILGLKIMNAILKSKNYECCKCFALQNPCGSTQMMMSMLRDVKQSLLSVCTWNLAWTYPIEIKLGEANHR